MDSSRMITLERLREDVHNKMCTLRNLDRIVYSADFRAAWEKATSLQRSTLIRCCDENHPIGLKATITQILCSDLEAMPYAQIRDLAARERIVRYSRLTRHEMILAIQSARAARINRELGIE